MKHIVVGTAGHIDHGKTTLIKALTGAETDTLHEEKKRGISINLGFTFFDLPSGRRAGIIDVPGHEKFIKNMLAGVSGIDVVMLVIAADEGIMPQTKEHLEILQILNVKKGIIVLTKKDLVDEEWFEMMKEEIKNEFAGTFLEDAKMIGVSSKTKEGIDELISEVDKLTEESEAKDSQGHFRLPVDRAFSVSGFGTVVTGTIISGSVHVGDEMEIYPSRTKAKVRGIQVHGAEAKIGEAGQRCAINLANVKKDDVGRGSLLAETDMLESSMMVDMNFYYLKSMKKPLENRQRVRVYQGTSEILGRVVILDKEEIKPGENAYVQLRLEEHITCQRNDRLVIRSYSPMHTIGGGSVIEPVASKSKRFKDDYIDELKVKEEGKLDDLIENALKNMSGEYPSEKEIVKALGKNEEDVTSALHNLVEECKVIKLTSLNTAVFLHRSFLKDKEEEISKLLEVYHKNNPLKVGAMREEIKSKVFSKGLKQKQYDEILSIIEENQVISVKGEYVTLATFEIVLSQDEKKIKDRIIDEYIKGKYTAPKEKELEGLFKDKKAFKRVFELLIDQGELVKCAEDIYFTKKQFEDAKNMIVDFINKNGSLSTGDSRELLDTSRKYVVAILEKLDAMKVTKRRENERILW